ncbi:hypothetical protein GE061_017934 [Apolygus lucorum]|uniref:DUF243 domain-containing protein n=1 Tax=Apolygus lucorum TaxID=248454 RepID=A0A8S9XEI7_APOLU|nr:hypothetical protein GE061_017934 [Apolygus lucorum]
MVMIQWFIKNTPVKRFTTVVPVIFRFSSQLHLCVLSFNMSSVLVLATCLFAGALGRPDGYNYDSPHGEPLIQKHIYVHVPPPDPEFHAPPQRLIPAPPPKKHYKIVFIKAPTYAPPTAPAIPELQQHQEKTLIYVLHKNPQDAPPIVIPTAKPTQPSKPEVYFIRYKTQKEVGYAPGPPSTTS